MYKPVKNVVFTEYPLQIVFIKIINIANNCQLTQVSKNCNNREALTQNQFLIGKFKSSSDSFSKKTEASLSSRKR